METSITQIGTKFIRGILEYFSESRGILTLSEIERDMTQRVRECACELMGQYMEEVDARMLADKAGRRAAGYTVERRHEGRRLLTACGEVYCERTYYSHKGGGYARVSDGVSVSLAGAACRMSYAESSRSVADGIVSRQTVMNKVRECSAVSPLKPPQKRRVSALHIDADEAHVTLRGGRKSIVPLISVYEGIDRQGKRGVCRNVIHISEYGRTPDELWEQALSEAESRYELDGAAVYLHGDGAAWVKKGLEWFPNAVFVLDKYHKNKEITAMTAGLDTLPGKEYQVQIRYALARNDSRFLAELADSLIAELPWREAVIRQAARYLSNQIEGVAICSADPESNNGGCTEPHVSHVLAGRLSGRPMAWSKQTLTKLAPMLAGGGHVELCRKPQQPKETLFARATRAAACTFKKINFAPHPRSIGALLPISNGKRSSLYSALRAVSSLKLL